VDAFANSLASSLAGGMGKGSQSVKGNENAGGFDPDVMSGLAQEQLVDLAIENDLDLDTLITQNAEASLETSSTSRNTQIAGQAEETLVIGRRRNSDNRLNRYDDLRLGLEIASSVNQDLRRRSQARDQQIVDHREGIVASRRKFNDEVNVIADRSSARRAQTLRGVGADFTDDNVRLTEYSTFIVNERAEMFERLGLAPNAANGDLLDTAAWLGITVLDESYKGLQFGAKAVANGLTLGAFNDVLSPLDSQYHSLTGDGSFFGSPTTLAGVLGQEVGVPLSLVVDPLVLVGAAGKLRSVLNSRAASKADNLADTKQAVTDTTGCFVKGTLVHTQRGLVAIEEVRIGDGVLSQPDDQGEVVYKRVDDKFVYHDKSIWEVRVVDGVGIEHQFIATPNHPFWVNNLGWSGVEFLEAGQELELTDKQLVEIVSVRDLDHTAVVYNMEVADFHTYYVGELGIWVHNMRCGEIEGTKVEGANKTGQSGKLTSDNQYFTRRTEFQAPSNGTGINYKVNQLGIDPNMEVVIRNPRNGRTYTTTNKQLMEVGNAPYVIRNGSQKRVELHHSRQNANGPLFELGESTHKLKTGQGGEALHPYKTNRGRSLNGDGSGPRRSQHPDYPVDRPKFDIDRKNYWQQRIIELRQNQG